MLVEKKYLKKFFLFKKVLPLTYRKQQSNRINLIKMKNFNLVIYADEDFNSTNIISSINFECKSVTTAFKIIEDYIPDNFGSFKLFDSNKCRCFSTKENHLNCKK